VFWLGLYAVLLPLILPLTTPLVRTLFIKKDNGSRSSVSLVLIDRGLRLTIIGAALLWLTYMIDLHPNALPDGDVISRILVGAMRSIIILLVADLFWQLAKAYINRKLELASQTPGDEAENARNSRLQTLLPILRNMLSIVIAMVAIMMALSELGVQIAPLIASAGIFGIALGFGSQTLVKDIISGIFYMVDDAFRIGEYIQSGSYKGTVESFSIRSVKLRHHRGPIFTVPFGTLGAVENMSRDWSIDKFLISVSYNTNLNLVKSVVKKIGAELLLDPELGPSLIETVKLKGVEQFGDYGITLGFGMTVKPGGQPSIIRRRAYAMIREAFIENGIEFASPMVQVAQGKDSTAAAAALSDVKMHQKSAADDGDGTTT
jgi:small conductance mechanosensitive channel